MCRFVLLLLILVLLACTIPCAAAPVAHAVGTPPATSAASHVLMDADSGRILAEKDADVRRPMASTTKIMTALLALELLDPERVITVPPEAVGVEGSSIYLYHGERITVRTLLFALMLSSANDAAVALAIAASGSVEAFAARMNEKAAELGLADTHFCNPNGLHEEAHYTTARDLARLTAAALSNEAFAELVATRRYTAPQDGTDATRLFLNHNRLLRTLDGAIGVKTGFTRAAGRCLVSAARRDGLTLIAVTLHAPDDWRDHASLLEWGFSAYRRFTPSPADVIVPVVGGTQGSVTLTPSGTLSLLLPRDGAQIECLLEAPRFLFGGFGAGEVKGRLVYYVNGKRAGDLSLVTASGTEAARETGFLTRLFDRIKHFFTD